MLKLSEKAKIILAVIAVAVVAAGAVTFVALSINANSVQDDLYANGGRNGVSALAENDDFSIVFDYYNDVNNEYTGRKWSTDLSNPTVIGMYTGEDIVSYFATFNGFSCYSASIAVTEIDAVGNKIGESATFDEVSPIAVKSAGTYIAEVTVQYNDSGADKELTRSFYAQVKKAEKTVLEVKLTFPQTSLKYTGSELIDFGVELNTQDLISDVIEISVAYADYYVGETHTDGINIQRDLTGRITGMFDVTCAGRYTVKLNLTDYGKEAYKFADNSDTAELKFEVERALVSGSVKYNSDYSNGLTAEQLLGEIEFAPSTAAGNDQTGKYTLNYSLYDDAGYGTPLTGLSVGKDVFVKAAIAPYSQGDETYLNYRLPAQGETGFGSFVQFSFKLTAPALAAPSVSVSYYGVDLASQIGFPIIQDAGVSAPGDRTVIYATYLNFGYKVSQWFYGSHDLWTDTSSKGYNRGENWNVTVSRDGGTPETVDPNTYEMKNAGTYVVSITPKEGFRFAEKNEYTITLIISPFTLASGHIVWESDTKHVYDGNPVNFGREDYQINLPELLSADNEKIVLEIERIKIELIDGVSVSTVIDEAPINAGTYTYRVKANGIKGEVAGNYKLSVAEINNSTSPFKIYKQELPNYSGTPLITGKFNGTEQVIDIAQALVDKGLAVIGTSADGSEEYIPNIIKLDQSNFNSNIAHSYPISWGVSGSHTVTASLEVGRTFRFTRAGSYSVTFMLPTDSDFGVNHCWYGDSDEPGSDSRNYVWESFILIERAEIDPSLSALSISVNDEVIDLEDHAAQAFKSIVADNPYVLTFGSGSETKAYQFDFETVGSAKKYKAGEYYLLIDLDENLYPDCIFNKASADAGNYTIQNDGKRVRIEYSVNSNTVSISYTVADYVFGDNFADSFGVNNVFTFDKRTVEGATVLFGEPTYEFYADEQRMQTATLHNGLPRNAGKYYFTITINYTVDGESFVWTRSGELNVEKRPISAFVWTLDNSEISVLSKEFVYNGAEHTLSVAASLDKTYLPAVGVVLSGASATDVGNYTFNITGLTGDDADNYKYDGLTNVSFNLVITPAQVDVTANNFADIKFGQAFNFDENAFAVSGSAKDLFESENLNVNLSLAVYFVGGSSLALVTEYGSLGCGQYLVIPVYSGKDVPAALADNKYVVAVGNYELTMTADGFSVTAEELIVTLYGGSSSVYGDPVNLYVPRNGDAGIYETNLNLSEEEFKRAVTLTATTKPTGGNSATADKAKAGTYIIKAALTDYGKTNYSIKVNTVGENGSTGNAYYYITRRKVTLETKDVVGNIYGNGYNYVNNVYNITSGSILDSDKNGLNIYCGVFVYNGQFNNKTGELSNLSIGEYYHFATFGGAVGERLQREDGKYYTVANVGNYEVTSIASKYEIVPRQITLTFTDGSSVYGENIDLWKRQSNYSETDRRYYSTYDYCQAVNLRFDGGDLVNLTDSLKDVITLNLVKDGNAVLTGSGVCNAGTYQFKAAIKEDNPNYVIVGGTNGGREFIGGQFVVSPKPINIQTTASKPSVSYGDGLTGVTLDFTVNGLVSGDEKDGLNLTVAIYDGNNKIENVAEYGVGSYVAGVDKSNLNPNYVIAENGITTAGFAITKRTLTLTFTTDGASSQYGETVTNDMLYAAAVGSLSNLVNGHTYANAVSLSAANGSVDVTAANASAGTYLITAALKSGYSDNYNLTVSGQGKYVITPRRVVLKPDAVNHSYKADYDATSPKYVVAEGSFVSSADEEAMQIAAVVTNRAGQTVTDSIASQPVGAYVLKLAVTNANPNYDVDVTTYTAAFTIIVRKATVTFKSNPAPSNVYGEPINLNELRKSIRDNALFTIDALLDGDENNVEISIVKRDDASVSAADKHAPVGDYVIIVTLGGNYDVEYVNWTYDESKGAYSVTERSVKLAANDVSLVYGNGYDVSKLSYGVASDSLYQPIEGDDLGVTLAVFDGTDEISSIATQNVGNYFIKIDKSASNANYNIEVVDGKFAITQATIKLTAKPQSVTFGNDLTLSGNWYTASSDNTTQATITAYLTANAVTYETNYVKGTTNANATGITVTPKCVSNANVAIAVEEGAVTVNKRVVTLTFTSSGGTSVYGQNVDLYDVSVGALAANDLVGTDGYSDVVTLAAKIDGHTMEERNYAVGTYTVTATIANGNYVFADNATTAASTGKYVITPAAISWTGSVDANKTYTYSGNAYAVDDVSAKLSFTVVKPELNNVTIEYLAHEAGHACDGTLPWNNATTTVPSYTNAGAYTVYVRFTAANHSTAYLLTPLTLTINKGVLTITAKPHSVTYGNDLVLSGEWYTATSDTITETAIAAYLANHAVSSTTNYDKATTQANASGVILTPSCSGDDNVQVNAVNGAVTVNKRAITVNYISDKFSVYGNAPVDKAELYEITDGSLVNSSDVSVTVLLNGEEASSTSSAGTYVVSVTANGNYQVTYFNDIRSGAYVIKPRSVNVSLVNNSVVYTEEEFDGVVKYNGGQYGKTQNAAVNFDGVIAADTFTAGRDYTVTYTLNGESAIPNKAGVYDVTVELKNGNYVLEGVNTFEYEIVKKQIASSTFMWEDPTLIVNAENKGEFNNGVKSYVSEILQISENGFTVKVGADEPVVIVQGDEFNTYYYENGQLRIRIKIDNTLQSYIYTVSFGLNSDAQRNYELIGNEVQGGLIKRSFSVSSKAVTAILKQQNWQYSDELIAPNTATMIDGALYVPIDQDRVVIRYAPVIDGQAAKNFVGDGNGYDFDEVKHLFADGALSETFSDFDVGYYIVCVTYNGIVKDQSGNTEYVAIRRFDVFEITKKQLSLPRTLESDVFDGGDKLVEVNFDMTCSDGTTVDINDLVTAEFKGGTIVKGDSIRGKNAGTYTVTFEIKDKDRYVWTDAMEAVDGKAKVTWTIEKDNKEHTDSNPYITIGEIKAVTYGNDVAKSLAEAKAGYSGAFTWYFALKGGETDASKITEWKAWTDGEQPTQAGDYFVKVVLSDGNKNFTDKTAYDEFTINKATLRITISGGLEYGHLFAQTDCNYNIVKSDLIPGDTVSVVNGSVSYYYLVDDNEDELTISGFLDAKEYNLSVARDVNGHVYGLTADNYDIVLAELGKFTVTAKPITVKIGVASCQYGLEPVLTDVEVTYVGVDSKAVIAGVKANFTTTADETKPVGVYEISSTYANSNFTITYQKGTFTITARRVNVTLDNSNSGGIFGSTIKPVTFTVTDDGKGLAELVAKEFTITVCYNGTAYDNVTVYNNSVAVPTQAGVFTVTAMGDATNKNFELIEPASVNIEVEKQTLDESKIKFTHDAQKVYTGEAIEPVLNDEYNDLYDRLAHEDFIEVGNYTLQIQLKYPYNYKWTNSETDIVSLPFEIVKAGIKVVPGGSITYGQTFNDAELSYKLYYVESGALVEAGVVTVDEQLISYFVNDVNYNAAKPVAGKYALEMGKTSEGSDFVNGFTSPNFKIVLEVGKFEVKKRDIEITVNNSSSIYSQSITLNNGFEVTSGELVWEEDKDAVINFTITANPANWINAGSDYIVTATATADNYNIVKVNGGKHTIKQLEVTVTITATDGVYFDKTVNVTTSQTGNIDYDFGRDFAANYVFKYTNTATGAESNEKPSDAGSYRVTVTGINDGNFKLVSVTDATFAIAKKVVDQDDIAVKQGAVYNGQNQSHGIIAVEGVYSVSGGDYVNADSYTVTLTLTDSDNYSWKNTSEVTVTKQFVISQAPLTLKPNGQITYGDDFAANTHKYGYELIGLTDADKNKDYSEIVTGNVTYVLADENVKLNASDAGYDIIAHIDGLTCQNYRITAETGKLIVNKRDITIKPYASQSYYGEEVILSRDFIDVNKRIVAGDSKADFNYVPSTAANPSSDVNKYEITATASNSNYNITFDKEYHVIVAAKVGVRVRPINGIYGDEANLGGIELMSVVVIKSDGRTEDINDLQFAVLYEGTANDKTSYSGIEVPTKAGVYTATVTSVLNNENYVLDAAYGDVDTVVVIEKCQIDADKIKATSASYTGKAVIPHIEDSLYNVNGRKVYNTIFEGSLINVGTYGLTLSLIDTNNYAWVNNLNRTATIKFEIVKADNSLVDASNPETPDDSIKVQIPNWTFGETASKPQAEVANGEIVFEYATSENGAYTTEVPRNAGEYWVRATVAESDSYNAFVSKATKFVINKKAVDLPVAANLSGNSVYTGSMLALIVDGFDDQIMSLKLDSGMYRSDVNGKLNLLALNAGTYQATFKLRNNDNYVWADDAQLVDGAVVVNWTVERQIIKRLPDATSKILVNGEDIVFIPEGFNSGIMTIESNVRAHEGNFSAIVTLKDTANYAWEGTDSASIAVNFELTGTNTVFIAAICVVAGLSVGLAVMAVILTLVNRRKKRKEAEAIDARSRADGWEGDE